MKTELEIIKQVEKDFSDKIVAHYEKYEENQNKLLNNFNYNKDTEININISDDFYDDGFVPAGKTQNTYAYIENNNIPDAEAHKILNVLINYIVKNSLLPKTTDIKLTFCDSFYKYPILVLEHEYMLTKRWQIDFKNITHKSLENLIKSLKKEEISFNKVKFDIYSES